MVTAKLEGVGAFSPDVEARRCQSMLSDLVTGHTPPLALLSSCQCDIILIVETKLALLADYANVTRDGKLNLMGVSNTINARALPWVQPQIYVVLQFEVGAADWETEKGIEVQLLDADGNRVSAIQGNVKVARPKVAKPLQVNSIFAINNLKFNKDGEYVFVLRVDGQIEKEIPLRVNYVPALGATRQ